MGKYLHHYMSETDFKDAYIGDKVLTALTISGGEMSTGCEGDFTETHNFDGKYVLQEGVQEITLTNECNSETDTITTRIFKKDNINLYDEVIGVSDEKPVWLSEEVGYLLYFQDTAHAYKAGDAQVFADSLEYEDTNSYIEPWVSYTEYDEELAKVFTTSDATYEFVEEVDEIAAEIG